MRRTGPPSPADSRSIPSASTRLTAGADKLGRVQAQPFARCLLLIFSICLTGSQDPTSGQGVSQKPVYSPAAQALLNQAIVHFQAADYRAALSLYELGLSDRKISSLYDRTGLLLGIANCELLTNQFGPALRTYNQVLKIARSEHFQESLLKAEVGRASLYRRMGNFSAAAEAMRQIEPLVMSSGDPMALTQAAFVAREVDFERAVRLYRAALLMSQDKSQAATQATIWNQLGYAYLLRNRLDEADQALTEAFRIRALHARAYLQISYFHLGWLRRKQGDYRSAIHLLERSQGLASQKGAAIPSAYVQRELGRAYAGVHDDLKALEAFSAAVQLTREGRLLILPSEAFRVSAESERQNLYAEYIQTAMNEFERTGDRRLIRRMLEVAEESRSTLFRSTLVQGRQLPAEYFEKLAKYRGALAASLDTANAEANRTAASLKLQLADLESGLGLATPEVSKEEADSSDNPLQYLQGGMNPNEALLSFHTGDEGSFIWAVTKTSFEARRLPAGPVLRDLIIRYRQTLEKRSGDPAPLGIRLSQILFGQLSYRVRSRPDWILSLDGALFELPFSALPGGPEAGGPTIGELHALRRTPTAILPRGNDTSGWGDHFVGVADPVYNAADPRFTLKERPPVELARLPGTGKEIARCARAWGRDSHPVFLTGAAANREAIRRELESAPAILHVATHVLPHPSAPDQVMVALGLQTSGEADYLTPTEIATWRKPVGLVTLSGCSSGTGAAHPGLGLFGLTRAWLLSGAASVVATYWPIPDDDGQLFSEMYRELAQFKGAFGAAEVARALQHAQKRMRELGGWRSEPSYWAGYFVTGKY